MAKTLQDVVTLYREIRAKKDALKAQLTELNRKSETVENILIGYLSKPGNPNRITMLGRNLAVTERASATVQDFTVFIQFVKENERWDMLHARCNNEAAMLFLEEKKTPPPGVKIGRMLTLSDTKAPEKFQEQPVTIEAQAQGPTGFKPE